MKVSAIQNKGGGGAAVAALPTGATAGCSPWTIGRKLVTVVTVATTVGFAAMTLLQLTDYRRDLYELETENNVIVTTFLAGEISGAVRWKKADRIEEIYNRFVNDKQSSTSSSTAIGSSSSMLASFAAFDGAGKVLARFQSDSLPPYDLSNALEVGREALEKGETVSVMTANHHMMIVPVTIGKDKEPIGTLAVTWSRERLQRQMSLALTSQISLAALILLGLVCLLTGVLNRIVISPVKAIHDAMNRQKAGDRAARAPSQANDEIGEVAQTFNGMLDAIEERNELKRSNTELEQFAYVASHDLQEPLRMVASYCQLLQRRYKGKLDADADDFISFAVDGAMRMQKLINDLLTYSRVGMRGQAFESASCAEALEIALLNLDAAISESGAKITSDSLPTVTADITQLVQLYQNLVANAIKFRRETPVEIHVGAKYQNDQWRLWVRDNGIGIDPQYAERIFLIFRRLHGTTEYPGTGIGLAVCMKIVERHGGQIWVEPEPNHGSTFYFTLPAAGDNHESHGGH